ncbi:hypothetical protein [Phyllobacterium bourgognense]|uniref:hypothetical protein n=1 Tax=Phyllobacterium bourgognense TaxID=314236 RepID=UPI0015F02D4C|nr:hypothetical protein [Phyllobacterium bourgognense]
MVTLSDYAGIVLPEADADAEDNLLKSVYDHGNTFWRTSLAAIRARADLHLKTQLAA